MVKFGGHVDREYRDGKVAYQYKGYDQVLAVPYDVPVVGYGGKTVNPLRLWYAQPLEEKFDLAAFNRGDYAAAVKHRNEIEAITSILYPDDSTLAGKKLRLQQEYLLVAAGVGDLVRRYKRLYGEHEWSLLPQRLAIHINDTHPTLCVPELMRLLLDEEGLEWDEAWEITTHTIAYTNHTVLPEALEKWPIDMPCQCGLFIVILSLTLSLKTVVFFHPLLFLRLLSPHLKYSRLALCMNALPYAPYFRQRFAP